MITTPQSRAPRRKFCRTVYCVEVLSEDTPATDLEDLGELNYAITEGHCSGTVTHTVPLCESMDLSVDEINELLDRADDVWEQAKGTR